MESSKRWTLSILALLALVASACAEADDRRPPLQRGAILWADWARSSALLEVTSDVVVANSFMEFDVARPVTLVDAAPISHDGMEVLASRVTYLYRARDGFGIAGYPGTFCTNDWPPRGFGPSSPVEGLEILPGDSVVVTLFMRAEPGEHTARGLVLTYETEDGRTWRAETEDAYELTMITARTEKKLPGGSRNCNPDFPSTWLGDTGVNDRVVVIEGD